MGHLITEMNRVALGDVIRRSAWRYPKKEAIVDGSRRYTYTDFYEHTNQVTNYLIQNNFQKGMTIATICTNSYEHVISMYGIEKAACIWVPVNPGLVAKDMNYIFKEANIQLVIVDEAVYEKQKGLLQTYECLLVKEDTSDATHLLNRIKNQSKEEPSVQIEDRDTAHIMFTSGTTSNAKGVMTSHLSVHLAALGTLVEMGFSRNLSMLGMMPYFHCAQHTYLHMIFTLGGKLTVMKNFDAVEAMTLIDREQITVTFFLPMMYRTIVNHPDRPRYSLKTLEDCVYAMTPMDQVTLEKAVLNLDARFWLISGQTEMYPGTMLFRPEYQLSKKGSYWGEPTLQNDVAIMDEEGTILPFGQRGEIVHKGPNMMKGYLNNPEETEASRKYGWHHTGDIGYFDEDQLLVFVDRKKDLIKTGGENVASIHIEEVLLSCELVENVAVVGLPHPVWIEAVTAFIIAKEGATEEAIFEYCEEHLANFQIPKKIVIVDEFPTTTTGKIQKYLLQTNHLELYKDVST